MFRFDILEIDEHVMEVHVSSNREEKKNYDVQSHSLPYKQIRGPKKREMKTLLKYRSIRMAHLELNKDLNPELVGDGNVQDARRLKILYKIKSEERYKSKQTLKSAGLEDMVQSYLEQHKLADQALREVVLPLRIIIFTEEQLRMFEFITSQHNSVQLKLF